MAARQRLVVLSGATGTIGRKIAEGVLAQGDTTLVLPLRSADAAERLVAELRASVDGGAERVFWERCDLADFASVRAFCALVGSKYGGRVSVLINNAAVVPESRTLTVDGYEQQWQVNVLSYYWLMQLLAPYLLAAAPSRVVNVASRYAGDLDLDDVMFERRRYDANAAYRQSKQADRLLTAAAARHLFADGGKVLVNCCHPGVVGSRVLSGLGFGGGYDSAEDSARTPLYLAFSDADAAAVSGCWFVASAQQTCSFAKDRRAADRLWALLREQTDRLQ